MSPEFERLVGRAVGDKAFRDRLLADPEQAIKDGRFNLSDEEIKQVKDGIEKVNRSMTSEEIDQLFGAAGNKWHS